MNETDSDNSTDIWQPLFEGMSPKELSRKTFEAMVRFASIPPTLTSFGVLAINLIPILKRSIDILAVQSDEEPEIVTNIQSWIDCCEDIVARRHELEVIIPDLFQDGPHLFHPPEGFYRSHSLGVTLCCRVNDPKLIEPYHLLQAYLLLAHYYGDRLVETKGFSYRNAKKEACLAVRNIAKPALASILRALPTTPLALTDYHDTLSRWKSNLDIRRLRALFTDVITERKDRTYEGRVSRERSIQPEEPPFNAEQVFSYAEDDDERHPSQLTSLTTTSLTASQITLRQESLCSQDEFTSPREKLLFEHGGPDPSGGFSRSQYQLMAEGFAAAVAMQNQKLTSDWDRLTPYEVQAFLVYLVRLADSGDIKIGEIPATELAAFMSILFWTSSTPEGVLACTLLPAAARCSVQLGILRESNGPWNWVIKPCVPVQRLVPQHVLDAQAMRLVSYYNLPIPQHCVETMKGHLDTKHCGVKVLRLFTAPLDSYKEAAALFLGKVRLWTSGRQTTLRISLHLHELIARTPGADITTAMSITGRNDPLGSISLHYTVNSIPNLEKYYLTACNQILDDAALKTTSDTLEPIQIGEVMHVGSKYVPRVNTVRQLSKGLRDCLDEERAACERGEQHMVELHNAMVVYTLQMVGFATGYRNVRDPLLQEAEIDEATGFAVISDKDDDTYYHSRIIWLPGCCIEQLNYYREHMELFQEWLFFHDQEIFFRSREKAVTGRHADRYDPSLLIIGGDGRDNPLNPSVMKRLVHTVNYELPGNANRHLLRSSLLARECPVEVINAFMGHWFRGMEPWGRYSGLSPIDYRQELTRHLVPLLRDDGWQPTQGLMRLI